ncbi:hypothetical protein CFOL_v3_31484 [Cephalotus follicularis]|uniref:Uncharacterized protein n=1 Tax=Cephalotus follicularis TaxID=3775 RepID=A0A1Q3D6F4_CEPFO|nr:hypothetical protein CFOL_v3_31484 [Cephalotus follicularis]
MGFLVLLNKLPSTSPTLSLTASSSASCSSRRILTPFSIAFASPISILHIKPIDLYSRHFNGFWVPKPFATNKRVAMIVKAAFGIKGTDSEAGETQCNSDELEDLVLDKVPLDPKLQLKLEQKMRMKSAKRIRLRGKKLIHKRRMRKKGRWPPSKMNKLKNV